MKAMYLLVPALTFGWPDSHAQNLLTNGSFEVPPHSTNSEVFLPAGSTDLTGWIITGTGSVTLVTTPLAGWSFMALDGKQFLDFNEPGVAVCQSFNTRPGGSYEVTFSVGYFQGDTDMAILAQAVSTNGTVLGSLLAGAPPPSGWKPPSQFRFTATDPTTTLQFQGSNATINIDLALDDVSVLPVTPALAIGVSQVRLCWQSQTNRLYQLQYSSNLTSNSWTDLGAPILSTGNDCSEQPVSEPRRFYRVILLP